MRVVVGGFIVGAAALGGGGADQLSRAPAGWPAVEQIYHQQIQAAGIVGSSLVLVRDGHIVANATAGLQDRDRARVVDADTIFHWASRVGYVISFNTDVSASKTNPSRPTTRQVDAVLRDAIIREVIGAR